MFRQFIVTRPLQAIKLVLASGTIAFGSLGIFAVFGSTGELAALVSVPPVGLLFVVLVVGESLLAIFRWIAAGVKPAALPPRRLGYVVVRAVGAGVAFVGAGVLLAGLTTVSTEALSPPAGVGLALIMGGVAAVVVVVSLGRCLVESYAHRSRQTIESNY